MEPRTKQADVDWPESNLPCRKVSPPHLVESGIFGGPSSINRRKWTFVIAYALLGPATVLLGAGSSLAQVSPAEITNPKLKAAEQAYLPRLQSLQHAIGETKFPLPFILTRYVGMDPARQAPLDTRGLEFVYFQDRILLKTSGFYTAAFNSEQLTPNERAYRTFQEVIIPMLRLITNEFPADAGCDGLGFEIAYHVRAPSKNSDFEGREILAVVLDRADAFAFLSQSGSEERQLILNRSEIYLDGKVFGLALGQKDALNLEVLGKPDSPEAAAAVVPNAATARVSAAKLGLTPAGSSSPMHAAPAEKGTTSVVDSAAPTAEPKAAASPADTERLQAQFQSQLDALMKEDGARFHLVDYAPASFGLYHRQLVLQLTLRNPVAFEKSPSSIYRRAAQSFDLFLAPQLKALVLKLPPDLEVDALDFSILNRLGNEKDSSEAIEFICPLRSIRSFVEDEIGTQDLINQSFVLVNGVRIRLDLELVE